MSEKTIPLKDSLPAVITETLPVRKQLLYLPDEKKPYLMLLNQFILWPSNGVKGPCWKIWTATDSLTGSEELVS